MWKWLSCLACRLYTVHDSRAPSSGLGTIAMYNFRLVSWLIPLHSYTFFLKLLTTELAVGFTVIDVYVSGGLSGERVSRWLYYSSQIMCAAYDTAS